MPCSRLFLAALALACQGALAQTTTTTTPAVNVQRLAPQLVAFAGSQTNFQNLVTGLAQGTPVQLVSVLPDGSAQIVTFTPGGALAPEQIAQSLEAARQRLIGLGIANPTAEQLAFAVTGGTVPTAFGGTQVPGVLPQTAQSPAAQVQGNLGVAGAGGTTPPGTIPGVNVQNIPGTVASTASSAAGATAAPRTQTSDSPIPAGATSRSPVPTTPVIAPGAGSTVVNPNPTAGIARR
jgi:hypothetical protein